MVTKNPFADYQKAFSEFKVPNLDMNQAVAFNRRNAEAFSTASSVLAESAQAVSRQQVESARANYEQVLNAAKKMMVSGSPEINPSTQAELARSLFESSLNNLRDISELVSRTGFMAFDVINKRTAESLEEISEMATKSAA
ncbi:MAG: phasin family protein [Rickettsiales bacterium]|nr:phasin family protein [Rickettsiales bacterium]